MEQVFRGPPAADCWRLTLLKQAAPHHLGTAFGSGLLFPVETEAVKFPVRWLTENYDVEN